MSRRSGQPVSVVLLDIDLLPDTDGDGGRHVAESIRQGVEAFRGVFERA